MAFAFGAWAVCFGVTSAFGAWAACFGVTFAFGAWLLVVVLFLPVLVFVVRAQLSLTLSHQK